MQAIATDLVYQVKLTKKDPSTCQALRSVKIDKVTQTVIISGERNFRAHLHSSSCDPTSPF